LVWVPPLETLNDKICLTAACFYEHKIHLHYKYLQRHQQTAPRLKDHSLFPSSQARYNSIDLLLIEPCTNDGHARSAHKTERRSEVIAERSHAFTRFIHEKDGSASTLVAGNAIMIWIVLRTLE